MITTLLKNEIFVKQLERIARELEYLLEDEADFSFFFPKLLLNIEGLMKMYHPGGSNTFDYMTTFDDVIIQNEELKDRYIKNVDKNNDKLRQVEIGRAHV